MPTAKELVRITEGRHQVQTPDAPDMLRTPEVFVWPKHEVDAQASTHLTNNLTDLKGATRGSSLSPLLYEQLNKLTPTPQTSEVAIVNRTLATLALYRHTGQPLVEQVIGKNLPAKLTAEQVRFLEQILAEGVAAADRHPTDAILTSIQSQAARLIPTLQQAYFPSSEVINRVKTKDNPHPQLPGIFGLTMHVGRTELEQITDSFHSAALDYATSGMLPADTVEELMQKRVGAHTQPSNLAETLAPDLYLYRLLTAPDTDNIQLYFALNAAIENISINIALNLDNPMVDIAPAQAFLTQLKNKLKEVNETRGPSYATLNNDWFYGLRNPDNEDKLFELIQMACPTSVRVFQDSKGQMRRWAPTSIVGANPTSHLASIAKRIQRLSIGEQLTTNLTLIPPELAWNAYLDACKALDIPQPTVAPQLIETSGDVPAIEITRAVIDTFNQKGVSRKFSGLIYPIAAATAAGTLGQFVHRVAALPLELQDTCTSARAAPNLDISDLQTAAENASRTARISSPSIEHEDLHRLPTLVEMQSYFAAEFPTVPLSIIEGNCTTILKAFTMALRKSGHELIDQPETSAPRTINTFITGQSRTGKSYVIKQMIAMATKLWGEPMGIKPIVCDIQASSLTTETFVGKKWHDGITKEIRDLVQATGMHIKEAAEIVSRRPTFLILDEADQIIMIDPNANGDQANIAKTVQNEMRAVTDPGAGTVTIAYRDMEGGSGLNVEYPTDMIFSFWISSLSRHQDVIRGVHKMKGKVINPGQWVGIPDSKILASIPNVPPDMPNRFSKFDVYPALTPKDAEIALTSTTASNPLRALQADIQLYAPDLGLDISGGFVAEKGAIDAIVEHASPHLNARGYAAIIDDVMPKLTRAFQNQPTLFPVKDGTIHLTRETVEKVLGIKK